MKLEKNISLGKNNFILILLVLSLFLSIAKSEVNTKSQNEEKFVEIKILDKVSSTYQIENIVSQYESIYQSNIE